MMIRPRATAETASRHVMAMPSTSLTCGEVLDLLCQVLRSARDLGPLSLLGWPNWRGRLGRSRATAEQCAEPAAEQVGVSGPAGRQVSAVLDDEGGGVVDRGAAGGEAGRTALELGGRIAQRRFDLVF